MKKILKIQGMHCSSCAMMIEGELLAAGIKCKCSFVKQELETEDNADEGKIAKIISDLGYSVLPH